MSDAPAELDLILPDADLAGWSMAHAVLVALLALGAEAVLGLALFLEWLPALAVPALHVVVAAVLGVWGWLCRKRGALLRSLVLLTGATLVFGPLGAAGTLLLLAIYPTLRRRRPDFEAWYAELFPEPPADMARDTLDRIAWAGDPARLDRSVASFTDILTYGTAGQKQTLINLIAERYRPEFAPVLQKALMHSDPTIRVLTATAVSMIESRMQAELRRRRAAVTDSPDNAQAQFALAEALDDYAHCGLLDGERRSETEEQARQVYDAARNVAPKEMLGRIDRSLGRLYLRMQRPERALAALDRAAVSETLPPSHLAWRLECLYRLGHYSRLRLAVAEDWQGLASLRNSNQRLADTLRLWAQDESERPPDAGSVMTGALKKQVADVCLLLEGTFPYVAGGVSTWVNDLLRAQQDLTFHIVTILADRTPRERRYQLPPNVLELEHVYLHDNSATGGRAPRHLDKALAQMEPALIRLQNGGGLDEIAMVKATLDAMTPVPGREVLLNSPQAWELLQRMYRATVPHCSFLDYFWTWRAQLGGLFAVLSADLPPAKVYHTISTGYAGLMAARAKLETGRPTIITEHGIYTNERRIEITMAEWLSRRDTGGFSVGRERTDLRDLWINTFLSYSRACYEGCDRIITLFGGNQILQRTDGAPPERLEVIPNGIDYDRLSALPRDTDPHPPTVAFIGRVVSIKDVKTFIRAIALLRKWLPDVKAYILGPTEEEEAYHRECLAMCAELNLEGTLEFTGRVNLNDWFGRIDVIALTSVSEAQPLVILEAGAAGIPTVATDVGACREMLLGRPDESPKLGAGGVITPLASPSATARGLADLLLDDQRRARYGVAIKSRVERYYNKLVIDRLYHDVYDGLRQQADTPLPLQQKVG